LIAVEKKIKASTKELKVMVLAPILHRWREDEAARVRCEFTDLSD